MKRKALWKDIFREIRRTRNKFLAIFAIVAIGAGFFAGVKVTCSDMKQTAQKYYQAQNLMDLHLQSTMGLTEDDVAAMQGEDGVKEVQPGYSTDAFVAVGNKNLIVRAISVKPEDLKNQSGINRPVLKEGRFPERSGECVADSSAARSGNLTLGSTITLTSDEGQKPITDTLDTDTFTVVGVVDSPLYVSFERGKTQIGSGSVNNFIFVPEQDFHLSVYTDVYITCEKTVGVPFYEDRYQDLMDAEKDAMQRLADVRTPVRLNEVTADAKKQIEDSGRQLADGWAEYNQNKSEFDTQIADAKQKLADGRTEYDKNKAAFDDKIREAQQQLAEGQAEYDRNKADFETGILAGERELSNAESRLAAGRQQYEQGLARWRQGDAQYQAGLAKLAESRRQLENSRQELSNEEARLSDMDALTKSIRALVNAYSGTFVSAGMPLPEDTQRVIIQSAALDSYASGAAVNELLEAYVRSQPDSAARMQLTAQVQALLDACDAKTAESSVQLNAGKEQLAAAEKELVQNEQAAAQTGEQLAESRAELDSTAAGLAAGAAELEQNEALLEAKRGEGSKQLTAAEEKLRQGRDELESQKQAGEKRLADALTLLQKNEQTLAQQEQSGGSRLGEALDKLQSGERDLADAKKKLDDVQPPVWYVWDRSNNPGYAGFTENAEKVDRISQVFPVFFILVAGLVCLTTMTRMVEEQRIQIGTLKALGYSKPAIIAKYISYALLASILGCAVGLSVGFWLFPTVIFNAYRIMYIMPQVITPFHWDYAAACALVAMVCTGASSFAACYRELMAAPAALMRPAPPKTGKRVLLERVGLIWNRLSFLKKVTVRNLFRYKKRILMTVIGIAGCTALMLAGFGLQHAITSIIDKQYGEDGIFKYDAIGMLDDKVTDEQRNTVNEELTQSRYVKKSMLMEYKSADASGNKSKKNVYIMVPQDAASLSDYINLRDRVTRRQIGLPENGAVITEKMAKLFSVKAGDSVRVFLSDNEFADVTVTGVTENYAMNYVYMSPQAYKQAFGKSMQVNTFIACLQSAAQTDDFAAEMLKDDAVLGVSSSSQSLKQFKDMMQSLNYIVLVIIISAGALAFVVLYNLANINLGERIREIATIKVLGFHDNEVSAYLYRENILSSAMGMLCGLLMGIPLERFIVATSEVDVVMFAPDIPAYSFLFAAALTLFFAVVVNFVMYFTLKKVDMVESLKSVE